MPIFMCARTLLHCVLRFVRFCEHMAPVLDPGAFTSLFLPELVKLASDPVVNVRLAVAKTLVHVLLRDGTLSRVHACMPQ